MPRQTGVSKAVRVWLSVGTSVLIGAAGTACTDRGSDADTDTARGGDVAAEAGGSLPPGTMPGPAAGGEGEGEGEGASTADPATDDIEYLHRLGQARGHLVAFMALHRLGEHEMSMTHAKHPESELYADLVPAFTARGLRGFAQELAALADAVETGENVDAAYAEVRKAISANEPEVDVETRLTAIATLARTAGDEFAIGVAEDGSVTNAHEYQDAYGFLTAAREMLAATDTTGAGDQQAIEHADEQLETALAEFDALTAERVGGNASVIHGAAARMEIEATMLP